MKQRTFQHEFKTPNSHDSAAGLKSKSTPAMFFSVTKNTQTGIVYLKVVNSTATTKKVKIDVQAVKAVASHPTAITLKVDKPEDTNTIIESNKITPTNSTIKGAKEIFEQSFLAYFVTVPQLQIKW